MKKRVITAVVALLVLVPVLWFADALPFPFFLGLASIVAVYEVGRCFGIKAFGLVLWPFYLGGAALPLLFRFVPGSTLVSAVFVCTLLVILFVFSAATFSKGALSFSKASSLCCFLMYILAGLNAILIVRDNLAYSGKYMFVLIFLGAWVTDAGAQLSGIAFGKHKLIPDVSPNKTVEGAVGGAVCGIAGYAVFALVVKLLYNTGVNWWALLLLGAVIAVIDQIGDLIASYVKREHGIKDYGNIFPGHGGVIDRIDSIVSNALVVLAYVALGLPQIFL